jgi:hypothetical protein
MPKRRTNKYRGSLKDHEVAWLVGDREAGFLYSLNHDCVRQALWDRAGDHENFRWEPGLGYPEPVEPG